MNMLLDTLLMMTCTQSVSIPQNLDLPPNRRRHQIRTSTMTYKMCKMQFSKLSTKCRQNESLSSSYKPNTNQLNLTHSIQLNSDWPKPL